MQTMIKVRIVNYQSANCRQNGTGGQTSGDSRTNRVKNPARVQLVKPGDRKGPATVVFFVARPAPDTTGIAILH